MIFLGVAGFNLRCYPTQMEMCDCNGFGVLGQPRGMNPATPSGLCWYGGQRWQVYGAMKSVVRFAREILSKIFGISFPIPVFSKAS
jgi:hypothetical protein